ncbi:hypothetical protein JX266_013650 [Neoarthrinium moseri]|nr:hypothetical protein JX266_013650 [Neoarthrinium moseri]
MHTREQKVKARRSGKSLLGKAKILGKKANVFSMAMYWDPVHKKMRTVVHLPPGQKMPSLKTFALKAISENSQQTSPAIHTDRGGSTQPALVSPVEAGQAASSSIYDFPGEEEDTIIVRDPPRRVDQASPISPQRTVSEVTIDEDALCQTLEVQAEQPDDLWCYRDGRSDQAILRCAQTWWHQKVEWTGEELEAGLIHRNQRFAWGSSEKTPSNAEADHDSSGPPSLG